ncbi:hypothetical protein LTR66_013166 [Elasticomyces elasticus]|nr:hypothetical protein LTR66_013166 [Elasticomyces elasticus]
MAGNINSASGKLAIRPQNTIARPGRNRRPAPNLATDPDNAARAAWRNGVANTSSYRLPRNMLLGPDVLKQIDTIARATSTHITIELKAVGTGRMLLIWGNKAQADSAKAQLTAWTNMLVAKTTPKTSTWAEVRSLTPEQRTRWERKFDENERKERYKQRPREGLLFNCIAFFRWPVEDFSPEEILGNSLEAFDPFRTGLSVYIVYDKARSSIKVMGNKEENVKKALVSVRTTCFQVTARQRQPLRLYCLRGATFTRVHIIDHALPTNVSGAVAWGKPPMAKTPRGIGALEISSKEEMSRLNRLHIKNCIMHVLRATKYYRGNIEMRVRLGVFTVQSYRKTATGTYLWTEFEDMIKESQFQGSVTQELGNPTLEASALARIQTKEGIFFPLDGMTAKLVDVTPFFSATFIIMAEPSPGMGNDAGLYRFEIAFQQSDKEFETTSRKWSRCEKYSNEPTALLDVSSINLADGHAWHLGMLASQSVEKDRVPAAFVAFADGVGINKKAFRAGESTFINYPRGSVGLKKWTQKTSWAFRIGQSDYRVEVTKFQETVFPSWQSQFENQTQTLAQEPRWSVSVHLPKWDVTSDQNRKLGIGQGTEWTADFPTWFPEDEHPGHGIVGSGDGVEDFMQKLEAVESAIMG